MAAADIHGEPAAPHRLHPLNLGLRFLLELVALSALAIWGRAHPLPGLPPLLCAVVPPALAVAAWSTFTVPGDPSRGDRGGVPVPGIMRLLLELLVFGLATLALLDLWGAPTAAGLAGATLLHYALAWRRLRWLLA